MDSVIKQYACVPFGELNYCFREGIMYQRDMTGSVEYNDAYFQHYLQIENSDIAKKLNAGRTAITDKYCKSLLDIGIGSGEFIRASKLKVLGFDINPRGVEWLKERSLFADPYVEFPDVDGLTFWDSLEHIPEPHKLLDLVPHNKFIFVSMPIFTDLVWIRKSKHYKPNEHYYYFTTDGMIQWMWGHGFVLQELDDSETRAGREDILTFVFKKKY